MRTLALASTVAWTIGAGLLVISLQSNVSAQQKSSGHEKTAPEAMILQQNDGEHLVHTSGPLAGVPLIIKVDGQTGHAEDFFVFSEVLKPKQKIPFHKHHNAEEILILDEAGAAVIVGNKRADAGDHAIVFIPRNTWISATNESGHDIHTTAIFSRQGFDTYLRSISAKQGAPMKAVDAKDLPRLRSLGHATYWDSSKGEYPPGVAHP